MALLRYSAEQVDRILAFSPIHTKFLETQYNKTDPVQYSYRIYTPYTPAHTYSHGPQYHRPLIMHNRGPDCHLRGITKSAGPINP